MLNMSNVSQLSYSQYSNHTKVVKLSHKIRFSIIFLQALQRNSYPSKTTSTRLIAVSLVLADVFDNFISLLDPGGQERS